MKWEPHAVAPHGLQSYQIKKFQTKSANPINFTAYPNKLRNLKVLFRDITHKPPVLFPLVGLFHLLWLVWTIWDDRFVPFLGIEWLQVLWILGYAIFWIAACDLRKWGAMGYIFLTLLDASLYLGVRNNKFPELYISNMFLLDGLFSFFLMFYYKKFK